jgi:peptide/nickel transport system permease protein
MRDLAMRTPKLKWAWKFNRRQRLAMGTILTCLLLISVILAGAFLDDERIMTHLDNRFSPPTLRHPFGTDALGRDMFTRTVKGLNLSLRVGLIAASVSALVALIFGLAAATLGPWVDAAITWLVDLALGMPHLVVIILIAFACGGGARGVIMGVVITHWPSLTRVIRAEVMQLRSAEFVQISRRLGKSPWWVATQHILPHILPQLLVGTLLLFPHAILHEASVTFLGFGLSPHQPAIGVILSEAMSHLTTGKWWLAFFPGLSLLLTVRAMDILGENLRSLLDPHSAHE